MIIPLFLSDVSGTEVLVIFLFILIFFGSKSIPTMARTFGRAMREIKNASADLQNEIKKSGLDVKNDLNLSTIIKKSEEEIQQPLDQVMVDIKETVHYGSTNLNEAADNINKSNPSTNNNSKDETEINTILNKVKSDSEKRKTEIKNESNG
ncbi:MAG: twin-arginine translocase TatA/TatE family subunit [Bacteroidetes bacterium]|nr:twin-arginine translocase TatA/TatE family subunit [Bacteroidota bacterium]